MVTTGYQFLPVYLARSRRYLLARKCQHQGVISQHQQMSLQVDQQSDDDLVETRELAAQELVDDEVHAAKGDEAPQQGEVPPCDENLHLYLLVHEVVIEIKCQSLQLVQASPRNEVAHCQVLY